MPKPLPYNKSWVNQSISRSASDSLQTYFRKRLTNAVNNAIRGRTPLGRIENEHR